MNNEYGPPSLCYQPNPTHHYVNSHQLTGGIIMKTWGKAAGVRALRSMAGGLVAVLTSSGLGVIDVDWKNALSVTLMTGIVSLLLAIQGLPEVQQ